MTKFLIKIIGLTIILASLLFSSYTSSSAADNERRNALVDSMQIQTIVTTSDATSSKEHKLKKTKKDANCNNKQKKKPVARKEISWTAWLTGSHKAPSLHFLDILELFGL